MSNEEKLIGSVFDVEPEKQTDIEIDYKKIEALILKTLDKRALAMFNTQNKFIGYGQFVDLKELKNSAK